MTVTPPVGFYGKLPSHGDFLRRRASDAFVGAWDKWLQESMAASRSVLADRWLEIYLTSPVWRFACAPNACGPAAVIGVMVPSVDRVGRYFPMTVVAELPEGMSLVTALGADGFFDEAERVLAETVESDPVNFERFDERVSALMGPLMAAGRVQRLVYEPSAAALLETTAPGANQMPLPLPPRPLRALEQLVWQRLGAIHNPLVIWWSEGSERVDTSCLVSTGLPRPDRFCPFLDGQWSSHDWHVVPGRVEEPLAVPLQSSIEPTGLLSFTSAAGSDVGKKRTNNEDAFLERTDVGLWAVADGLGGHSDGEIASRMVCDALADWIPRSTFDDAIDDVQRRIGEVNQQLVRLGERTAGARIATTVVVLLTRGTELAVVWAGDSRAYRWRDGHLERLTRDHSLAEAIGPEHRAESHIITRALGATPDLQLDVVRDSVRIGDRFLLCSDGLTNPVSESGMSATLSGRNLRNAVDELIGAALDAGGPDNVTALVVEASR